MDFWDLTKLLVRRWVIFVPLLVVSLGLAALTLYQVKPDYVATAYVQLVPPAIGDSTPGGSTAINRNPFLSQSLESLGNAAIVTVTDTSVVDSLKAAGYSESYTLTMGTDGPLVTFEVVGNSRGQAAGTADQLIDRFGQSVTDLQRKTATVADADLIKAVRLDRGTNVKKSTSKMKRAVVAVGGAGFLIDIGLTVGLDAWLRRRRNRKDATAKATAWVQPTGTVVASSAARARIEGRRDLGLADTALIPIGNFANGTPVGNGTEHPTPDRNGTTYGNAKDTALASIAAGMSLELAQEKASSAQREPTSQPAEQDRAADEESGKVGLPSDATVVLPPSVPRTRRPRPAQRRRNANRDTPA
ncbi:MAG: hypothetical protein J2P15_04525 [Micromonosporaceae bacterium]|nr:hypothetical protein [Micromonosporaceae bacterium]